MFSLREVRKETTSQWPPRGDPRGKLRDASGADPGEVRGVCSPRTPGPSQGGACRHGGETSVINVDFCDNLTFLEHLFSITIVSLYTLKNIEWNF